MNEPTFDFQPRWKEELLCSCELGELTIEMSMGVDTVWIPSRERWAEIAPPWAQPWWDAFHRQLLAWCDARQIPWYFV